METLQQERKDFESLGLIYKEHDQVNVEKVILAGLENYWFTPTNLESDDVVIYLHGGGFIYGSIRSHRAMVSHFAAITGRRFLFVEYSLAPEKPFPQALNETTTVIHELLQQNSKIQFTLMGDSAGGNLAMSVALNLKRLKLASPLGQVLISPWTNMKPEYESYAENEKLDPIITRTFVEYAASLYTDNSGLSDPLASPVHGSFEGISPTLTVAGAREILRDDAARLHEALEKAGCVSVLRIFPDVTHVWTLTDIASTESREVMTMMKGFLNEVKRGVLVRQY